MLQARIAFMRRSLSVLIHCNMKCWPMTAWGHRLPMRRRWLRDRCTPHSCRVGGRSGSDSAVTARRQAGGAELAVQRRADAAAGAEGRGVHAPRVRAIKADIAERLAHDDLTVAAGAPRPPTPE